MFPLFLFFMFPLFLSPKVVEELAKQMIGYTLTTKQTPKEGVKVNKVRMHRFCVMVL